MTDQVEPSDINEFEWKYFEGIVHPAGIIMPVNSVARKTSPVPINKEIARPSTRRSCANLGLQDGVWMFGCVAIREVLPLTMVSIYHPISWIVNLSEGVIIGAFCGYAAARIYETEAITSFKAKHPNRELAEDELNSIKRDAKYMGYKVFASMVGWTIGAVLIQIVMTAVRLATQVYPCGAFVNVAIVLFSGVGQTMAAVASFVSGVVGALVGTYLSIPVVKAMPHVGKALQVIVQSTASALISGFASFLTFFVAAKFGCLRVEQGV